MNANWTEQAIGESRLVLHVGGALANLDQVTAIDTPEPTKSWVPVPHRQLIDEVCETLGRSNLAVKESAFALYAGGRRFFGLLGLDVRGGDGEYQLVVGLRNSHDMSFPVGMVVGSRVFVCDNLAFSSEIQVTRRHTKNLMGDLPRLITTACGMINASAETQERRFKHYKETTLTDEQAHDIMIQSLDVQAVGSTALPKVLANWREPPHEEFRQGHTAWRLFNAYTETFKQYKGEFLPSRSIALQGLMDTYTRFQFNQPTIAV